MLNVWIQTTRAKSVRYGMDNCIGVVPGVLLVGSAGSGGCCDSISGLTELYLEFPSLCKYKYTRYDKEEQQLFIVQVEVK